MTAMTGRRPLQARHEFRLGTREVVIFGGAFLLIFALTFVLGVLVGRELARSSPPRAGTGTAAAEPSGAPRPPAEAEQREPAAGKKGERGASEDRLTFYKTLTAPTLDLPPAQPSHPPKVEERIVPHETAARPERQPAVAARPAPASGSQTAPAVAESAPAPSPVPGSGGSGPATPARPWTVQVSSFRSRGLADELRSRLQARGFDAYLVRVATDEGRVWHRVRVGGYSTRAEAERVATELRAERNLNPVVTTRPR